MPASFDLTIGSGTTLTSGVTITPNGTTTTFAADAPAAFLNVADMAVALASGSVVVESGLLGPNAGSLTVIGSLAISDTAGNLTLQAGTSINLNTSATCSDTIGNLNVTAGTDINLGISATMSDAAANLTAQAGGIISLSNSATISAAVGNMIVTAGTGISLGSSATIGVAEGTLTATVGTSVTLATSATISGSTVPLSLHAGTSIALGTSATITTTSGSLTATAGTSISLASSSRISSPSGPIDLLAGTSIDVAASSVVKSTTSTVTLDIGTAGGNGSALIQGTLQDGSLPVEVQGGAGATSVILDFANGAQLPNGLHFDGGAAGPAKSLTITDAGDTVTAHQYVISPTSVIRDAATTLSYSKTTQVVVIGGNLSDTFNVTAGVGPMFSLAGGGGTNVLNFNAGSEPLGTFPGGLAISSSRLVTYTNIATINLSNPATVNAGHGPDTADRSAALTGLTANERFVQALYLDVLGRVGSKTELDSWAPMFLTINSTQAADYAIIAADIEHSREGLDALVRSWYVTYLGRSAGQGEEVSWVTSLQQGQTEEQVLSRFFGTAEFFNRTQTLIPTGTSQERFVQGLYQVLLYRSGSAADVQGWVNLLPTLGQRGVAADFLATTEFRQDQFEGYYDALLHRPSDASGLQAWAASSQDIDSVRIAFESSGEFYSNG
ncbi:MAG TPA: hypothetical protein VGP68_09365 [Gemmataceae bacterium]|nr:hypothetical protein [Gemmataceae bacterium]